MLDEPTRTAVLGNLTNDEADALLYDWPFWARPEQLVPLGDWRVWLILAGRGFGKTRTGAETVRQWVRDYPLVNLIGATADDARDIMVEGESGILAVCPPHERPDYIKSARRLDWPNGARSLIFTADEPERLRGKQHMKLWGDELGAWRYAEAWDQAVFGLRLGNNPQAIVTTTPRPTMLIKELKAAPTTVVTRGTTYENRANLAPAFMSELIKKYEGTRLGRQELYAEILDDNPGALWKRGEIEAHRVTEFPDLHRIVVAVDPPASETGAEAGIIVVGMAVVGHGQQARAHYYVLDDLSLQGSPETWAREAVTAYHKWRADRIVGESNNGGDMVASVVRTVDPQVSFAKVWASRGKQTRAEPVAALYEQGRGHHVGVFMELEDQMVQWEPGMVSPDRMDALVWAITELMDETIGPRYRTRRAA